MQARVSFEGKLGRERLLHPTGAQRAASTHNTDTQTECERTGHAYLLPVEVERDAELLQVVICVCFRWIRIMHSPTHTFTNTRHAIYTSDIPSASQPKGLATLRAMSSRPKKEMASTKDAKIMTSPPLQVED